MTENEYTNQDIWTMGVENTANLLNKLTKENKKLKDENELLKQELIGFKKWEKCVGDVKRDDLDKVFKMSIYEIAESFAYYEKKN